MRAIRLANRIDNSFRDVQFELLAIDGCKPDAFLNVFCIPLYTLENDEFSNAIFRWDDTEIQVALPLLTGGQRLQLPNNLARQVIEALSIGSCVEIELGRYRATLSPVNFSNAYTSFWRLSGSQIIDES